MECPVRNHQHELTLIKTLTQQGSGLQAHIVECPQNTNRWFVPDNQVAGPDFKLAKPRWGWKA